MSPEALLQLLDIWAACGWIRPLERVFARFLHQMQPRSDGLILFSAAMASYQVGRGHICLNLELALTCPGAVLPPEGDLVGAPDHLSVGGPDPVPGSVPDSVPDSVYDTGAGVTTRPRDLLRDQTRARWEAVLRQSPLVSEGRGNTPLVLDTGRLYLRRYWEYEQQVARHITARLGVRLPLPPDLPDRLDAFFKNLRRPAEQRKTDIHWQSVAATLAAGTLLCVISGGPGTGKTTTVVRLLGLLQELALARAAPLRIRLATPTGKAAARLTESIGTALAYLPRTVREHVPATAVTLHRLLGRRPDTRHFIHNSRNPLHADVLVVDEASMIDLEMMAALLEALSPQARLILLGDKDQLASVEAGAVLGDLCREATRPGYRPDTVAWLTQFSGYDVSGFGGAGTALAQHICLLRKSHRFGDDSGIGALSQAVNRGNAAGVTSVWKQGYPDIGCLVVPGTDDPGFTKLMLDGCDGTGVDAVAGLSSGYRIYLQTLQAGPGGNTEDVWMAAVLEHFSRFQVLAALRRGDWGVAGLNIRIAALLCQAGLIEAEEGWYAGRPVLVTRNDYSLGLMNGDVGIALPRAPAASGVRASLRVVFAMPDGSLKKVRPSRLKAIETVYAMTVHKSQGSEFGHAVLVLPEQIGPLVTRELVYTGITRARRRFTLVSARADVLQKAMQQRTQRASGLGDLLNV